MRAHRSSCRSSRRFRRHNQDALCRRVAQHREDLWFHWFSYAFFLLFQISFILILLSRIIPLFYFPNYVLNFKIKLTDILKGFHKAFTRFIHKVFLNCTHTHIYMHTHTFQNCNFQTAKINFGYAFEESKIEFFCKTIYLKYFLIIIHIYFSYIWNIFSYRAYMIIFPEHYFRTNNLDSRNLIPSNKYMIHL